MNFVLLLLFGRFGRQGSIENVCNFAKVLVFTLKTIDSHKSKKMVNFGVKIG